ncbi:MAG: glycosyltransferase family 4 protein [Deltaproteobacteria bacterium]|nr:glycosyltransferase family 4 protein [Deltaproteobacteria bacterium]
MTTIGYYTPFKPLGFHLPSGDLTIATGLRDFLESGGHRIIHPSRLRARWIFWKPWLWPVVVRDRLRALRMLRRVRCGLWLTYHAYYKSPDLVGPWVCRRLDIPYVIFQGIYSTRRKKAIKTLPGYVLNRKALMRADHIFSNRKEDLLNLRRLIPEDRLTYIAPGIDPEEFTFDAAARRELRNTWKIPENTPVVLSAAMFRPGVKTEGLIWTIKACAELYRQKKSVQLVIAGDGKERKTLQALAESLLSENVRFVGKIPRDRMHRFYSAGDIFAFPGIRETLGMVYLEAQSCGLPVVAFHNGGIPEVVKDSITGFLTPLYDLRAYADAITRILDNGPLRREMSEAAVWHVQSAHDIHRNYHRVETVLQRVIAGYR